MPLTHAFLGLCLCWVPSCSNRAHNWGLKTTETYGLPVLEARGHCYSAGRAASSWTLCPLPRSCILVAARSLGAAVLWLHRSSLCLHLHAAFPSVRLFPCHFCPKDLSLGSGPLNSGYCHLEAPPYLYMQRPLFQIR